MEKDLVVSLLIGATVEYSITKDKHSTGIVLDKVLAKESSSDNFAVTKYVIEDNVTRAVVHVASWRILRAVPLEEQNFNRL